MAKQGKHQKSPKLRENMRRDAAKNDRKSSAPTCKARTVAEAMRT